MPHYVDISLDVWRGQAEKRAVSGRLWRLSGAQKNAGYPDPDGSTRWRVVDRDLPADWAGLKIDTINSGATRARIHWSKD